MLDRSRQLTSRLVSHGSERLPDRVRLAMQREQDRSEVLVCILQIAAIIVFAGLYLLTPKGFPATVPFEPVPWTLAAYAAFTAMRLWLALRRRLEPVFLRVSIVVDVLVLMITIWSFHLQYDSPPGIYLKAPTLLYGFILIAFRVLRLEAELIWLAGGAVMAGWGVLVVYAIRAGDAVVTHDYARYMTSYDILIGAEVDKVIAFGVVTMILAIAVVRSRRLLVTAVTERLAADELARFFAPEVADRIRSTEAALRPGVGDFRRVAVMIVDLRGFTRMVETLSPSAVMELLSAYQALVSTSVRLHHGSIDKFLGDGILASFGAIEASTTYAADAMRAALDLSSAADRWIELRMRSGLPVARIDVAIATGTVMFGTTGTVDRLEYTLIGEPVNLAAKLEKHTKVEQARVLCPADSFDLAVAQGFVPSGREERRSKRSVSGLSTPLDLQVLISLAQAPAGAGSAT